MKKESGEYKTEKGKGEEIVIPLKLMELEKELSDEEIALDFAQLAKTPKAIEEQVNDTLVFE